MNIGRRKQIEEVVDKIDNLKSLAEEIKEDIDLIKDEEEEYLENIPENLQSSERYEKAETAVENLNNAYEEIESIDLDSLVNYLTEAME